LTSPVIGVGTYGIDQLPATTDQIQPGEARTNGHETGW